MAKINIKSKGNRNSSQDARVQIAESIFISAKQHENLITYIRDRLDWGMESHDVDVNRYEAIDKEVSGFIRLTEDDYQRKQDNQSGDGPKPYDVSLQLTKTQIDEAVTFLLSVYFPEEGAYGALAPEEKQDTAKGFTTLMNTHSATFGHYSATNKFLTDALKYNIGLLMPFWEEIKGTKIQNDTAQQAEILKDQILDMGNELTYLDPYNTILDPSVSPTKLHRDGEFFATIEPISTFRAKRMALRKEIYNTSKLDFDIGSTIEMSYYKIKPDITGDAGAGNTNSETINWVHYLSGKSTKAALGAYEFAYVYIWLNEKEHGLSNEDQYAIWRMTMVNSEYIVLAEKLTNAHGFLPCFAGVPWDDNFESQTQSFAEILLPYQRFSSFQMNLHQHSARKSLYGLTFYNERLFPNLENADIIAGKVPFQPSQELEDARKHVFQLNDTPDTSNTLRDIAAMEELMQKILPTDILKQVTDLQRATQYQAAATVQGANRRNLKIAQLMESQAFGHIRSVQVYNIMQYQKEVEIFDKQGNLITIDPAKLRDEDIKIVAGAGLRGLDKMIVAESLKEILQFLVQSPQAAASADIMEIINYITSLVGDYTDFNQFKFKNEFDKLTPEQKQQAFVLLQNAIQAESSREGNAQAAAITEQGQPTQ